jgi:hypothetical protein
MVDTTGVTGIDAWIVVAFQVLDVQSVQFALPS